jgi:hypothetical protein
MNVGRILSPPNSFTKVIHCDSGNKQKRDIVLSNECRLLQNSACNWKNCWQPIEKVSFRAIDMHICVSAAIAEQFSV